MGLFSNGVPTEYSWRGVGPWYKELQSIAKEIPTEGGRTVYDELKEIATFDMIGNTQKADFSSLDKAGLAYLALKYWCASEIRSKIDYSKVNMSKELFKTISFRGAHVASSVLAPWVGSDSAKVSAHQASLFFRRNLFPGPPAPYYHPKTDKHEAFVQGNGGKWLIFVEPINDVWFLVR
jgi:hypothetical protein